MKEQESRDQQRRQTEALEAQRQSAWRQEEAQREHARASQRQAAALERQAEASRQASAAQAAQAMAVAAAAAAQASAARAAENEVTRRDQARKRSADLARAVGDARRAVVDQADFARTALQTWTLLSELKAARDDPDIDADQVMSYERLAADCEQIWQELRSSRSEEYASWQATNLEEARMVAGEVVEATNRIKEEILASKDVTWSSKDLWDWPELESARFRPVLERLTETATKFLRYPPPDEDPGLQSALDHVREVSVLSARVFSLAATKAAEELRAKLKTESSKSRWRVWQWPALTSGPLVALALWVRQASEVSALVSTGASAEVFSNLQEYVEKVASQYDEATERASSRRGWVHAGAYFTAAVVGAASLWWAFPSELAIGILVASSLWVVAIGVRLWLRRPDKDDYGSRGRLWKVLGAVGVVLALSTWAVVSGRGNREPPKRTPVGSSPTPSMRSPYGTITFSQGCNLRSLPEADSGRLGVAEAGEPYPVIEQRSGWRKIRVGSLVGWVGCKPSTE